MCDFLSTPISPSHPLCIIKSLSFQFIQFIFIVNYSRVQNILGKCIAIPKYIFYSRWVCFSVFSLLCFRLLFICPQSVKISLTIFFQVGYASFGSTIQTIFSVLLLVSMCKLFLTPIPPQQRTAFLSPFTSLSNVLYCIYFVVGAGVLQYNTTLLDYCYVKNTYMFIYVCVCVILTHT